MEHFDLERLERARRYRERKEEGKEERLKRRKERERLKGRAANVRKGWWVGRENERELEELRRRVLSGEIFGDGGRK